MEEKNEKAKNIIIGILIGVIFFLVIALVYVSYNNFIIKDNANSNDSNKNIIKEM